MKRQLLFPFVMCTVSIPRAFIWSALFSAMVKNFFGSDRASTIAACTNIEGNAAVKVHYPSDKTREKTIISSEED